MLSAILLFLFKALILFAIAAILVAMAPVFVKAQSQSYLRVNSIGNNPYGNGIMISNVPTIVPKAQTGTILHIVGASPDSSNSRVMFDNYYNGGSQGPVFGARRSRGTSASPTAPILSDVLAAFTADGWGVDSFHNRATASMVMRRDSGTYSNTSAPSRIVFATTPDGAATQRDAMVIDRNGVVRYPLQGAGFIQTDANGFTTSSALTGGQVATAGGKLQSDSGRGISHYVTGVTLNKVRDSLATLDAAKVRISDTASMLANYAKTAAVALKVNISDTVAMLMNYAKSSAVALKVNISDTAAMLANYLRKIDTVAMLAGYVRKGDTSLMLQPYVRKADLSAKGDTVFTSTLGSGVRLSTTKKFLLNLYVSVTITSALVGNNQGNLVLQRSPDNATWTTIASVPNSMVGVLSTSTQTVQIGGLLPAGYYYKLIGTSVGANTNTFAGNTSNATEL